MNLLWRISRHEDLEGLGGERADGRWHTSARGKRIVYLSEHPAVALIEVLANLKGNPSLFPESYRLMKVIAEDRVSRRAIESAQLDADWRDNQRLTQKLGDDWLIGQSSALLLVPSAPAPESTNILLNPLHPDAMRLSLAWSRWLKHDKRLFHIQQDSI